MIPLFALQFRQRLLAREARQLAALAHAICARHATGLLPRIASYQSKTSVCESLGASTAKRLVEPLQTNRSSSLAADSGRERRGQLLLEVCTYVYHVSTAANAPSCFSSTKRKSSSSVTPDLASAARQLARACS
jgi:hypothetical protein